MKHPRRVERLCHVTGALLVLSGLAHLLVFAVDGGPWDGPVSWRKPATFGLSFGLTLIGLTWATSYLRTAPRARAALLLILAVDCVVEVGGITLQAWRRVPSHLNMETPFDTAVSMTLAVGGGVLVVLLTAFAVASFQHRPAGPAGMPLAVRSGFAMLLLALASGAAMIARGVVLTRTGHQEAAYHSTAPLKPLHGVSLDAVPHVLERADAMADGGRRDVLLRSGRRGCGGVGSPHVLKAHLRLRLRPGPRPHSWRAPSTRAPTTTPPCAAAVPTAAVCARPPRHRRSPAGGVPAPGGRP